MPLQKCARAHDEWLRYIDQCQVGMVASGDASLAINAESPGRTGREKVCHSSERKAALVVTLLQEDRQRCLNARNASPNAEEVISRLHFRRRRRMIGTHNIDAAVQQARPQTFTLRAISKRRRALRNRA